MKIDPRFIQTQGRAIYTGNELLVKGALEVEGGVHLLTGYPGSPIAGFFDTIQSLGPLLSEHGVVGQMASNEALSVAMVNGAQMAGCRAITAFKSVGLHVASDALALGVLAGTQHGSGGLIVVGDDPWSESTQVPADSRFLAEHVRMPVIEPCCPQEVKDWIDLAFKIGEAGEIYVGYLMTVAMADGGGTVQVRENHFPKLNQQQQKTLQYAKDIEPNLEQTVLLPPRTWQREIDMPRRFANVAAAARKYGVNRIEYKPGKGETVPMGLVVSGTAYAYLSQALATMGLTGKLPVLKIGMPYPVDKQIVTDFAEHCEQLIVIEERRGFVERQIREILDPMRHRGEIDATVWGKQFPNGQPGIPEARGLSPSLLIERLVPLLREHPTLPIELTNGNLTDLIEQLAQTGKVKVQLPRRTPAFCPGCPHRDSSSTLLDLREDLLDADYMSRVHKSKPVDLVAHGDTGCYTMLMFEPNKPLMHNYSGMGLGGATGAGVDPFITNKQLVFMGDGTFYHSGQTAIAQSIYNKQDIAYIILDNKTTAMTGHQGHAGVELGLTGQEMNPLEIERICNGMVPRKFRKNVRIVRMDPSDRDRYRKLLERMLLADGVKIIIADKECGITHHRRVKRLERAQIKQQGFLSRKTHMNVAEDVCEFCLECTTQTGCPGLKTVPTDYGPKVQTDMSWCVNDGACERVGACPSFEELTIVRKQVPRMGDEHVELGDLPEPAKPIHAGQDTWRCYLAGVGGMGIGLSTAILTRAGHAMGYDVQFLDRKGMAIRNGGVFSQLVYARSGAGDDQDASIGGNGNGNSNGKANGRRSPMISPVMTYGQADLLLGIDILEATRAIDPIQPFRVASPGKTAAVINTARTPTITSLMGIDDFDVADLEKTLRSVTRDDGFVSFNVGDLCERVLDTKLYANIMMLGIAFQKGFLPLTSEAIEQAITETTGAQKDRNLRAFAIGRKIAVRPDLFVVEHRHNIETARQTLRRKVHTVRAWWGGRRGEMVARQFRVLMRKTFRATRGIRVDDSLIRDVIIRAYDCLVWGGIDYTQRYCDHIVEVFHKDHPDHDYQVTRAVVHNLAKVMLIKDEVYVSSMLTSPEKYRRDRRRFNVNPERGDRIVYRHHNRPEFEVLGQTIRFTWKSRDWQLRLMSHARFLRQLLPKWHHREVAFRDWYESLVEGFSFDDPREYRRMLAIFETPHDVTGYREVRYPKMEAARRHVEDLQSRDLDSFSQQNIAAGQTDGGTSPDESSVPLTVLN